MRLSGRQQSPIGGCRATVMKEEKPLTQSPKRCGPELVPGGRALRHVVGQGNPHVMHGQV
jgi:hypothetical protein